MELAFVLAIGILFTIGIFLILRRSYFRLILGLGLLGNAVNLMIFLCGGLVRGGVPIIPMEALFPAKPLTDPVPQALILTAIVIGFGFVAFAAVLFRQISGLQKTDDLESRFGEVQE